MQGKKLYTQTRVFFNCQGSRDAENNQIDGNDFCPKETLCPEEGEADRHEGITQGHRAAVECWIKGWASWAGAWSTNHQAALKYPWHKVTLVHIEI